MSSKEMPPDYGKRLKEAEKEARKAEAERSRLERKFGKTAMRSSAHTAESTKSPERSASAKNKSKLKTVFVIALVGAAAASLVWLGSRTGSEDEQPEPPEEPKTEDTTETDTRNETDGIEIGDEANLGEAEHSIESLYGLINDLYNDDNAIGAADSEGKINPTALANTAAVAEYLGKDLQDLSANEAGAILEYLNTAQKYGAAAEARRCANAGLAGWEAFKGLSQAEAEDLIVSLEGEDEAKFTALRNQLNQNAEYDFTTLGELKQQYGIAPMLKILSQRLVSGVGGRHSDFGERQGLDDGTKLLTKIIRARNGNGDMTVLYRFIKIDCSNEITVSITFEPDGTPIVTIDEGGGEPSGGGGDEEDHGDGSEEETEEGGGDKTETGGGEPSSNGGDDKTDTGGGEPSGGGGGDKTETGGGEPVNPSKPAPKDPVNNQRVFDKVEDTMADENGVNDIKNYVDNGPQIVTPPPVVQHDTGRPNSNELTTDNGHIEKQQDHFEENDAAKQAENLADTLKNASDSSSDSGRESTSGNSSSTSSNSSNSSSASNAEALSSVLDAISSDHSAGANFESPASSSSDSGSSSSSESSPEQSSSESDSAINSAESYSSNMGTSLDDLLNS